MPGDAEATRRRLITAAIEEFAAYGLAGGRVDRIAAAAKANKAQIYHYFGSKDQLFDAALAAIITEILADIPPDPSDIVAYAGQLFDSYEQRPEVRRMATWRRLERDDSHPPLEAMVQGTHALTHAIAEAQKAGKISDRFAPVDLLALVLVIAAMWPALTHELAAQARTHSKAQRRKVITDAVSALTAT